MLGPVPYKLRMAFSAIVRPTLGALVAAALLAAGCGSPTPAASSSGNRDLPKLADYAKCMRGHGIEDFPDPVANPDGTGGGFNVSGGPGSDLDHDDPRFQAANKACQSLLPQPAVPPAQRVAAAVKLARCLRSHGFPSFPDPDSQGAFDSSKFDSSPQLEAAMKTCQSQSGDHGPIAVHPGSGR